MLLVLHLDILLVESFAENGIVDVLIHDLKVVPDIGPVEPVAAAALLAKYAVVVILG